MYFETIQHSEVPSPYPLGVSGLGAQAADGAGQPPPRVPPSAPGFWGRTGIAAKNVPTGKPKQYSSDIELLPPGYGLSEELIAGVPNWILYGAVTALVVVVIKKRNC